MNRFAFFDEGNEKPVAFVPKVVIGCLLFAFTLQVTWHASRPPLIASATELPTAPPVEKLLLLDLGDPVTLAKILMLWLQSFDNQPGISIPFRSLDYSGLIDWLQAILLLDDNAKYPLFAASRLYSEVPDDVKKRQILEFVYQRFLEEPDERWPTLAHAVYVAKHRLRDMQLALRYAHALANRVTAKNIPPWIKQMEIYVLEDMGEIESAKVLIGGLLESGEITDAHELSFLKQRLERLEKQESDDSSQ